jgi:hypothetical protein
MTPLELIESTLGPQPWYTADKLAETGYTTRQHEDSGAWQLFDGEGSLVRYPAPPVGTPSYNYGGTWYQPVDAGPTEYAGTRAGAALEALGPSTFYQHPSGNWLVSNQGANVLADQFGYRGGGFWDRGGPFQAFSQTIGLALGAGSAINYFGGFGYPSFISEIAAGSDAVVAAPDLSSYSAPIDPAGEIFTPLADAAPTYDIVDPFVDIAPTYDTSGLVDPFVDIAPPSGANAPGWNYTFDDGSTITLNADGTYTATDASFPAPSFPSGSSSSGAGGAAAGASSAGGIGSTITRGLETVGKAVAGLGALAAAAARLGAGGSAAGTPGSAAGKSLLSLLGLGDPAADAAALDAGYANGNYATTTGGGLASPQNLALLALGAVALYIVTQQQG